MDFEHYFRDELRYLKELGDLVAEESPALAEFLATSANDAAVMRLFEGFAALTGRLRQRIDDAFPEVTQPLLERVWPTPLHAMPSITVMEIAAKDRAIVYRVEKGTEFTSDSDIGQSCRFRTVHPLSIQPLVLQSYSLLNSPEGSVLVVRLRWSGAIDGERSFLFKQPIDLFLGPDSYHAGILLLWFEQYLGSVVLRRPTGGGDVHFSPGVIAAKAVCAESLALAVFPTTYWRLQLALEYFYAPRVADFVTLDFSAEPCRVTVDDDGEFTLAFNFERALPFQALPSEAFLLHCVPAINLFPSQSLPLQAEAARPSFAVEPREKSQSIHSITGVYGTIEPDEEGDAASRGAAVTYPLISRFTRQPFAEQRFYQLHRDGVFPGMPTHRLSFVDARGNRFDGLLPRETVYCELLCSNGKLAERIAPGRRLFANKTLGSGLLARNVASVSVAHPPIFDSHCHWPLIDLLSLNVFALSDRQMVNHILQVLQLYVDADRPLAKKVKRYCEGINQITSEPKDYLVMGGPYRGKAVTIFLNSEHYPDAGEMYRFALLLVRLLPYCLPANLILKIDVLINETADRWYFDAVKGS
ncbi:type VI secretion system baseplate subunit TssF [Serratia silvae]|uniref:Type VI secretion system baseplate subunit TssF n=1 Tax=Serratia silvae TaxID=2824122 RepID=A0ABT0K8L5_9GAMM|nr:type VI secretion system baseplate subunit TssF [Serratia silvae]MCL1028368.1 type VI secretion system baseplate subunit TssF [Serratia silvae]